MTKLAIFFPGIGYHADKPLLYYGRDIAYEAGFQTYRNISYTYVNKTNIRGNEVLMREAFETLYSQTKNQLSDIDWTQYDDVLFVSKSIGTVIASAYARKHDLQQVRHILYTPLAQTFDFEPQKAVSFIGTADAWSDVEEIKMLAKNGDIPLYVYENCNHSLECDDVIKNIDILKDVMDKSLLFLR